MDTMSTRPSGAPKLALRSEIRGRSAGSDFVFGNVETGGTVSSNGGKIPVGATTRREIMRTIERRWARAENQGFPSAEQAEWGMAICLLLVPGLMGLNFGPLEALVGVRSGSVAYVRPMLRVDEGGLYLRLEVDADAEKDSKTLEERITAMFDGCLSVLITPAAEVV
jgi:hypothetical protein